jgi:hypothetical protein
MILAEYVPVADELGPEVQYIVDGTLLPCWSWDGHQSIATSGQRRKWQWQAKEAKLRCPR